MSKTIKIFYLKDIDDKGTVIQQPVKAPKELKELFKTYVETLNRDP